MSFFFFTTIEKTKRLLTLLTIGLSSRNLWYSQLKDEDESICREWALSFGKISLNQNLKRQEEKKRIIHRKIQCASLLMKYLLGTDFVIPGRNEVTPNGRTDINIYNITVKGLTDKNTCYYCCIFSRDTGSRVSWFKV